MASRRSTETYTTNETASGNSPELTTPAPPIPDTIELSSPDTADHAVHSLLSSFINRRRTGCAKKEPATEPPESHQPPKQPSGCQPSASRLSTLHRTSHQRFDPLGESAQRKSKERESQISPAHDSIAVGSSSAAPASSILNGAAGEQANGKRPRSDSMTEGSATEVRATSRASEIKRLKMRLEEISIERRLMELAEEV
ncbi:hypothetical protein BDY17DRAFT_54827 [Neohortaea acidophila]|uniref:Uncharacterized protein n=1 Tax=Neohortaea acidophila TaxID=245834 RepID=A0A6A6PF31_9PEZI|nr:uncharacterized protein BDY17DRAFT_54827 [Neohortaea acidophila]KAF2478588.1 hypothetical protein BDY17DRAFT_54827 [Neohortaea acidophila]